MDIGKFRQTAAVVFQFTILGVLTYCLIMNIGDQNTILGVIAGLAVGVGMNSVTE